MPEHEIGTREEWQVARDELAKLEAEQAERNDGRSQLLAHNIMFGPGYTLGACSGCTNLGDGLDGSLVP